MAAIAAARSRAVRRRHPRPRILIRKDDFRISRFKQRTETTTIFVVDASGSAALHRLAEAKGAVELLLADCYIRRDQVALIAFRGSVAEMLLPPTRSLARAKRSLAGLPGGGGTPLAAGLDAAFALADSVRRKGQTPTVIVLTDGRANIARDGGQGRPRAEEDAMQRRAAVACCRHQRGAGRYVAAAGRLRRDGRQGDGRALSAAAACRCRDVIESGAGKSALAPLICPHPFHHLFDMRDRGFRLDAVAEVEDQPAGGEVRQHVVDRPDPAQRRPRSAPAGRDCLAPRRGFEPCRGSVTVRRPNRC